MILGEDWKYHFACVEAKIALEIIKCLINHLVKKKTSPPRLLKYGFYVLVILYFLKGVNP